MATSLAEQLQKLATPQTSLLQRDKTRASLLFDPKVAAGIDRDTFYDIGLSGLTELENHNDEFSLFKNNIFNKQSRTFERAIESKESNQKLDKTIRKFLMLLSPYFLIKPAQKALEWLIHRYSVHEYNKEDLLILILPYHETNMFVRCLQLIDLRDESSRWHWLQSLQKPGIHLPKINLFNHCASDVGFLKFIGKMTLTAIKENGSKARSLTTLFTFYCTTTIGALENSVDIKEPQVTAILIPLVKALISNIPDFTASGYMIIAQLLKKTTFSNQVLNAFVLKICSEKEKGLRMEATLLLLLIYQSQIENYGVFPQRAVKNLVKSQWFCSNLSHLAVNGSYVMPLLIPVLRSAMDKLDENHRKFVEKLVTEVRLGDNDAYILMKTVLDICSKSTEVTDLAEYDIVDLNEQSETAQEWYGSLLKRFETQYPNPFDKMVQEITTGKCSERHRKILRSIMNHAMIIDKNKNSVNTFEKLYHPNAEFRANAVRNLVRHFKKLEDSDKEMLKNVIAERLLDDNKLVVKAVLKLNKVHLFELLGENTLTCFVKLLVNCIKKEDWIDVADNVTKLICNDDLIKKPEIFLTVLPYLFPTNAEQLELSFKILNTKFLVHYPFFKKVKQKLKVSNSPEHFCKAVYFTIIQVSNLPQLDVILKTIKKIPVLLEIHKFLSGILISACVNENSTDSVQAIENIIQYLKNTRIVNANDNIFDVSVVKNIEFARNGNMPFQGVLNCIKLIINRIKPPVNLTEWLDLTNINEYNKFLVITISVLLKGCYSINKNEVKLYSNILKEFLDKFFPKLDEKINFLANISLLSNLSDLKLDTKLQLRILRVIKVLLQKSKANITPLLEFNSKILVSNILIGLSNSVQEIRLITMDILRILVSFVSETKNTFIPLLQELLKHQAEILLDHEQLSLILFTVKSECSSGLLPIVFNNLFDVTVDSETPIYVSSMLLKALTFINSNEVLEKTSKFALEILQRENNHEIVLDNFKSSAVYNVILRINEFTSKNIKLTSITWNLIEVCLDQNLVTLEYKVEKYAVPTVLILEQFTREVYSNLSTEIQEVFIEKLIHLASITNTPEIVQEINKIFKRIDLDAKLITLQLIAMKEVKSKKVNTNSKRKRLSEIPTIDILDLIEWKKGVTILEFIQDKKKLTNVNILLPLLFEILQKCLGFDEQAALEYPKQIVLSLILHCCKKMAAEGEVIPTTQFNMELVVHCIRASQNPQTHHHALLLLAHAASLIPDQVLHNIMAIFTFMGTSVLRHDDAYSFQIISKIIETVIPILVQRENEDIEYNVSCVLRVFVDVILDVPVHRRKALFIKLLMTLGIEEYLWLFLLLVFEAHVIHGDSKSKDSNKNPLLTDSDISPKRLDIATNIAQEFSIDVIIKTSIKLLDYIKKLPVDKEKDLINIDNCSTFNISLYTSKQFRHYKYTIAIFLPTLLSSKEFVDRIASLNSEEALKMEPLYKNMLINILTYIQSVSKIAEQNSNTPQSQYWKVMLHHCYNIMDSINALLTPDMFLLVIRGLIAHNILTIRRKAMELLNTKLQHQPTFLYGPESEVTNIDDLFALLASLLGIVKTISKEETDIEKELMQQTALLSLKLLIKLLASKYTDKFLPILTFITDIIKLNKAEGNLLASVMLCLAELCSKLRAHAISGLPKYMPCIIKALKHQRQQDSPDLLSMCIMTTIQKIVESLPLFLSPYLDKLLTELSIISSKWSDNDENQKISSFMKKISSVQSNIGNLIPSRVLLPIISNTYDNLIEKNNFTATGPLFNILSENLTNLRGPDLTNLLPELMTFFLKTLELRTGNKSNIDSETINSIEDEIIKSFTVFVLKLSETTFRPIFYKLYDWAVRNETKSDRIITFYRLSHGIAENLKSLFVLFAGHFVKNAASLLDACNCIKGEVMYYDDDKKNILLVESVLKTLHAVFLYDCTNFIDRDRFDALMQSIVDQLENALDGTECLKDRANDLITPCIAQFAVATADDVLWKQLNYQILLKTRSDVPIIRIIALNCLCEVTQKLGDEFLPLLPETIPFLAELLEDEDENVEQACQKAVQRIEKVVGEPLQKYF